MYCIANNIHPTKGLIDDLLVLKVENDALRENYFEYVILNNQSLAVRKGNFRGPEVQLCTRFFNKGTYTLQVRNIKIEEQSVITFEKY